MRASGTYIFRYGRIRTQMHKPNFLLVAPFPDVFIRRSVAYWVLLHLMRDVILVIMSMMNALPIGDRTHGRPLGL